MENGKEKTKIRFLKNRMRYESTSDAKETQKEINFLEMEIERLKNGGSK
jgi:hypothetical protein